MIYDMVSRSITVFASLFIIVVSFQLSNEAPVSSELTYLADYGYLDPEFLDPFSTSYWSQDTVPNAIRDFQDFFGLPVTGNLDNATVAAMNLPRCGVRDKYPRNARNKRFVIGGSMWGERDLTYKISQYPYNVGTSDRNILDQEIKRAFGIWSGVTPLRFWQVRSGHADIDIRFEYGIHYCGGSYQEFRKTVLAHAFYPKFGGDIHFNDAVEWTVNSNRGINLFKVAAHEIGHSLGLAHTEIYKNALMFPVYQGYDPKQKNNILHIIDVAGIQYLYGIR